MLHRRLSADAQATDAEAMLDQLPVTDRRPSSPVHKSPSLTVVENWLSAVVSTVRLAVLRTICFR
jgi:hypothetical protein